MKTKTTDSRKEFDEKMEHLLGTMSLQCEAESDEQFEMANLYYSDITREAEELWQWHEEQKKQYALEILKEIQKEEYGGAMIRAKLSEKINKLEK